MDDVLEALEQSLNTEAGDFVSNLTQQAIGIIQSCDSSKPDQLITTNLDLLANVIKPLFSQSRQHPEITSSGRKNQFPKQAVIPDRFGDNPIFSPPPSWKNPWTVPLIHFILHNYTTLPAPTDRKAIDSHFHLLVPPLLHLLDDSDPPYKIHGCNQLHTLCTLLSSTNSPILRRTGLTNVFVEPLQATFHHLPPLTPESEAVSLLRAVYPAYLALVDADTVTDTTTKPNTKPQQTLLLHLLRHSLLHSLAHLSPSPSTTAPHLTTFLLTQIPPVLTRLGIAACSELSHLIPPLTSILRDPFATRSPQTLEAALTAVQSVVLVCWPRISGDSDSNPDSVGDRTEGKWWIEIVRGLVSVYLNIQDEVDGREEGEEVKKLTDVMGQARTVVKVLRDVLVGQSARKRFEQVEKMLVDEEIELRGLFEG